jgi:UDP-glucuronate 4-epimerase
MDTRRVFITGTAGFIGYHLSKLLLDKGWVVMGYDGMTEYYDIRLKQRRHEMLRQHERFSSVEAMLEDMPVLQETVETFRPDVIVHLAAQAGVRFSIDHPRAYLDANITGTFNIMECARLLNVQHLLMASTSSVYGANTDMPFHELAQVNTPLTFYAATKMANEAMAHSYANIYNLPITMFRFFTVYGPWGRPDMALFKFTQGILEGVPIDVYNNGDMWRDFTFVEDLVQGIVALINAVPLPPGSSRENYERDSLSPVAPYRVVNIGNSEKVRLMDFIDAIEMETGCKAIKNYLPMQLGDVPATWADASLMQTLTGYKPRTAFREGVARFVDWYREYYN